MSPSTGKPSPPSDADIAKALGPMRSLWAGLLRQLHRDFDPVTEGWVYSGLKHGWALALKQKKRSILYLAPVGQGFRVSLALGPGAVALARERKLPARVLRLIDQAVRYPEGKAVRFEIHDADDVRVAIQLAAVKVQSQHKIVKREQP